MAASGTIGAAKTAKVRDPRLDFFRGIAMLIIFIAHVPENLWNLYIPARFSWSDATEMFVFCSGFAAAIAFGGTFVKASYWYGALRIGYRVWQIYAAHIAMFVFILTLVAGADYLAFNPQQSYVDQLALGWVLEKPVEALLGLFTLSFVPNYFDILPMYIGALILVPVLMALARVNPMLAVGFSVAVYLGVWTLDWRLSADWYSDRDWFFNPFAWQLLFFTGFSLAMGWIKPPPISRVPVIVAAVFVVLTIPAANWQFAQNIQILREFRELIWALQDKTDFGVLRYLHFLALAYLAVAIVKGRERYLLMDWAKPIVTVGQNSLAVFLLSMGLARVGGMVLDQIGREPLTYALVNLSGMAILIGFAYWCTLLKRQPWRALAAENQAGQRERRTKAQETAHQQGRQYLSTRYSGARAETQPAE